MSYWIYPGVAELVKAWEGMGAEGAITVRVRHAPHDDRTLETIFTLKGYERVSKSMAAGIAGGEDQLDEYVRECASRYPSLITSGKLAGAMRELAGRNLM